MSGAGEAADRIKEPRTVRSGSVISNHVVWVWSPQTGLGHLHSLLAYMSCPRPATLSFLDRGIDIAPPAGNLKLSDARAMRAEFLVGVDRVGITVRLVSVDTIKQAKQ